MLNVSKLNSLEQFGIICFIGTLLLTPALIIFRKAFREAAVKWYPLRALFSIFGMFTWMEAVKHFGANESILVNYLTPIIAIFIASLLKDERLKLLCLGSGVVCYGVIFFTLQRQIELANYGFLMAVISAFCWASYEVICKKQSIKEHYIIQVFYTFFFASIFLLPFSIQSINNITVSDWGALSVITVLRIVNVILLFQSIRYAGLNWLLPVSYMKLPIMATLGFLFFGVLSPIEYWIAAAVLSLVNIVMVLMKKVDSRSTNILANNS